MPPTFLLLIFLLQLSIRLSAGSGCIFLRDDRSIRCQNATLSDIGESLHILTMVVMNRPHTVEVEDCRPDGPDRLLPRIFDGIGNASIDTVRVRRSGLRRLHEEVFAPVAHTLRDLDLSHNHLSAVPRALMVLWALEHLNLQHNRIVFVRPDGVLDSLSVLRELNLAHNYIGQATEDVEARNGYQLKGSLTLEDFNMGQSSRSLESLTLRGNRLATVPDQISGQRGLPELRHLDLSENVIGKLESLLLLPKLQFLDLHSNRIQSVPFYILPPTLKDLDLTGNPLHCDCDALWLFEWSNDTALRLPNCHSPERFRERGLEEVPWTQECPDEEPAFRYITQGSGEYEVEQLVSNATSVTISWKVRGSPRRRQRAWAVVYRRDSDSPYQMTLVPGPQRTSADNLYTLTIHPLRPQTAYVICVTLVRDGKYTIEPDKCGRVRTTTSTDGSIRTGLEDIAVSATVVTLSWRLISTAEAAAGVSYRHEWTIRVRRTGSDNYTDIPVYDITAGDETDGQLYEYGISDLAPRTHYDVCLVDVEHRPIGEDRAATEAPLRMGNVTCTTVQTLSQNLLYGGEIAAIAFACAICVIITIMTIILCRQRRLLGFRLRSRSRPPSIDRFATATLPRVHLEPPPLEKELPKMAFEGAWNSLRLPYTDFGRPDRPEFRSFRTLGYRDALTTVTIYKSGYSEC